MGILAYQASNHGEAIEWFHQAIKVNPNHAACYYNLGNSQKEFKQPEKALESYNASIRCNPKDAKCFSNRGFILRELGRFDEALDSFHAALLIEPDYPGANFNFGELALLKGDFEQGWSFYQWRFKLSRLGSPRFLNHTVWLGEHSLKDFTILIHSEQGLGDTIQFIRYIPMLIALGAKVIVEVQKPLLSLLQGIDGVSQWIARGEPLPDFDFQCPLMSLPLAFKTTLSSIPPCLNIKLSSEKNQYWANQFLQTSRKKVGLVWSGGVIDNDFAMAGVTLRRNLPFELLQILVNLNLDFISLQKGEPAESELKQRNKMGWDGPIIKDYSLELNDFSDTAALIMNLDLVISVDTSTAHLAATLGKPVWLLNRFDTCWRWLLAREDSPWYPTLKIYRQQTPGDWNSVMQLIREDLVHFASV